MPSISCEARAAATPVDMPSFIARTASTLLSVWVRICSIAAWARSGFQFSMFCLATTLIWPLSIRGLHDLHLSFAEEVDDRHGGVAFDQRPIAAVFDLDHGLRHLATDRNIVKRNEGHAGGVDRHVVGDDGNIGRLRLRDGRHDRARILGQDDRRVALRGQQAVDVGHLLLRIALGVGAHVGVAGRTQNGLDPRFVDSPPLFLEVAPADANSLAVLGVRRESPTRVQVRRRRPRRRQTPSGVKL